MRAIRVLICLVVLLFAVAGTTLAAPPSSTVPSKPEGEVGIQSHLVCSYASSISAGIGAVSFSGYTEACITMSYVKVEVWVQRWNGSEWVDIGGPSIGEGYNTTRADTSGYLDVSSGYYYRTRSTHYVKASLFSSETATYYSSYVYVQ